MPTTFTDLLRDDTLQVRTRRDVRELYDEVKRAVRSGDLGLEGHSLPATLNDWIRSALGPGKELKNDVDVVDFSLADDARLARWRAERAALRASGDGSARSVYVSANALELFESVKALEEANAASLETSNLKKDDILGALSDLQAAVGLHLHAWDRVREPLRLPDRALPLERVKARKARKPRKAAARAEEGAAEPKAKGPTRKKRARKGAGEGKEAQA